MDNLYSLCHNLPKVELHCHLFGTIRKETFLDFNARAGKPFTDEEILSFYIRGEKPVGVLKAFRTLDSELIKYAKDLYRLTIEYLEDAKFHNIRYTEFSWNPTGTVITSRIPYREAQGAILEAIDDAKKQFGVTGRLICAIDREDSPERAVEMVNWMIANKDPRVLGIGIDYRETNRGPELFHDAYVKARKNGLKLTAHAGEYEAPWENVDYVLNTLKVDRIDHGYSMLHWPELVDQIIKEEKVITVVPTNSYYLRNLPRDQWAAKHPIRKMIKLGIRIHPNSDDPTLHASDSTKDWMMMVECFGAGIEDLKGFALNGIDGSWMSDKEKVEYKEEVRKYFT
ncbi:DEKNAAC101076 [Brettanomyces naardenensis]|uniref:DEKNAAC101076 n=1 Tax=Brettanomyces naardenensis TaxID=13370 RepID=A0A448YGW7_BRENA|nr:DEKNAAC101076 [Brettanomyces naardenensis]